MELNLVLNRGQQTLKMNPDMDWNGSFVRPADSSLSFLSNNANNYDQYPYQAVEMEAKYLVGSSSLQIAQGMLPAAMERSYIGNQEKKKRLTSEQLYSLERSFQEEIKLDPDRKTKLSRELGLQPRQIAVWFQNRRARWKTKQLENLYDSLKHDFDVISREKLELQEEVTKLKAMLRNQTSAACTEISVEERTVESRSVAMCSSSRLLASTSNENMAVGSYLLPLEDYNNTTVSTPYWAVNLPSYPQ